MDDSVKSTDDNEALLLAQIRECFGRVAYSHKTHEKQSDILLNKEVFWKWVQIILSVIVSSTLLLTIVDLFGCLKLMSLLGVILSMLLAAINLCLKNFSYGAEAQRHKEVAAQLWNIRETYISLITDFMSKKISYEIVINVRDKQQDMLTNIYKNVPRTTTKAYKAAQEALKFNEELTFSQKEIDMLLPYVLRLEGKKEKK